MPDIAGAAWFKSSYSNGTGGCVETAQLTDGTTAMRDSKHPDAGVLIFTPHEMDAFIKGVKAGEFDHLAS